MKLNNKMLKKLEAALKQKRNINKIANKRNIDEKILQELLQSEHKEKVLREMGIPNIETLLDSNIPVKLYGADSTDEDISEVIEELLTSMNNGNYDDSIKDFTEGKEFTTKQLSIIADWFEFYRKGQINRELMEMITNEQFSEEQTQEFTHLASYLSFEQSTGDWKFTDEDYMNIMRKISNPSIDPDQMHDIAMDFFGNVEEAK